MVTKTRYYWVDNVKAVALIFIVIGHIWQSFVKSGLVGDTPFYECFNQVIYYFHVQLFFICSGFLYQQNTKTQNFKSYSKNILKKLLAFGVPFVVFVTATYILKFIFADSVNTQNLSIYESFFIIPTAPYWFLYALFFLFLVSPIIKSKADGIGRIVLSIALYFLSYVNMGFLPGAINTIVKYICLNLVWFVLGMAVSYFDIEKLFKKWHIVFFVAGCTVASFGYFYDCIANLLYGLLCCEGLLFFIGACSKGKEKQGKIFAFITKYSMPIFLMHTICAAGMRSVLFKIGITNTPIHIVVGVLASIFLPVIAIKIMEKIKLDFVVYPTKYIKIK